MINYEQVINGLVKFIDIEIVPKMSGFKRLAFGVGSGIVLRKSTEIYNNIKSNQMLHALDILDTNNNINVDLLKQEIENKMGNDKFDIDIPMIGVLSLDKSDLNKLYSYIKN